MTRRWWNRDWSEHRSDTLVCPACLAFIAFIIAGVAAFFMVLVLLGARPHKPAINTNTPHGVPVIKALQQTGAKGAPAVATQTAATISTHSVPVPAPSGAGMLDEKAVMPNDGRNCERSNQTTTGTSIPPTGATSALGQAVGSGAGTTKEAKQWTSANMFASARTATAKTSRSPKTDSAKNAGLAITTTEKSDSASVSAKCRPGEVAHPYLPSDCASTRCERLLCVPESVRELDAAVAESALRAPGRPYEWPTWPREGAIAADTEASGGATAGPWTGTGPTFTFTPPTPGTITVLVTATNATGEGTATQQLTIQPIPCSGVPSDRNISIGYVGSVSGCYNTPCKAGERIDFRAYPFGYVFDARCDVYEWIFGDGLHSFERTSSHTYTGAGPYAGQFRVTNGAHTLALAFEVAFEAPPIVPPEPELPHRRRAVEHPGNPAEYRKLFPLPIPSDDILKGWQYRYMPGDRAYEAPGAESWMVLKAGDQFPAPGTNFERTIGP